MSNISEVEERLFVLLDTVENQTAEGAQLKVDISALLELVKKQQTVLIEQNKSISTNANQQIQNIKMTQQDFNQLVNQSISVGMQQQINQAVKGVAAQAMTDAIEQTAAGVDTELDKLVKGIEGYNKQADEGLYKMYRYNLKKSEEITESLDYQKQKLGNQYFKMIGVIGGGLFMLMCVFFWIIYIFTVPTEFEIRKLKSERAQLQQQITTLQANRNMWLNDAQRNGYPSR